MPKQTLNYFLDRPAKDGTCTVYLRFRERSETISVNMKETVLRKDWNGGKVQRLRKGVAQAASINDYLDEMEFRAKALLREMALRRMRPTRKDIEQALFGYSTRTDTIIRAYELFLAEHGKGLAPGTRANYGGLLDILRGFEQAWGTLHFANVNEAFCAALAERLTVGLGNNNQSANKRLAQLRTFLKWAAAKGLCDVKAIAAIKHLPDVDKAEVYLMPAELKRIEGLDLEGSALARAREVFLVQCYTGLRYSDAMLLARQHVKTAEGVIDIMNEKTGRQVVLPLLAEAVAILSRNGWRLPRIPNAKLNEQIKDLGRMAGLNEPVELTDMQLARKTRRTVEKWRCLTSHSARDTYATLLSQAGIPIEHIRKLLGHTTAAQTREYDKTTAADVARALRGK